MSTLRIIVALGLVGLWAVAFVVSIFDRSFPAPDALIPLALMGAGYLLGSEVMEVAKSIKTGGRNGD